MRFAFFLISAICFLSYGCTSKSPTQQNNFKEWSKPNGKLKVLATTEMIADVVRQVGGPYVDTLTLIHGELDPHSYQLVKGDDEKLAYADIIFYNGLGLEHGPSLQFYLTHHAKALAVGEQIAKVKPEEILYFDSQIDPHIWMDISLWKQIIPFVVQVLSDKDPIHAETFRLNGQTLYRLFDQENLSVRENLEKVPENKRFLVTSHDAFNYFTRAYLSTKEEREKNTWQKRFAAPEGLSPDSQLSSHDIQSIIDHLSLYHIEILFPESNVSRDSIRKILEAGQMKGLTLRISSSPLLGDAMGPIGTPGDDYLGMIRYNADTLIEQWQNLHEKK